MTIVDEPLEEMIERLGRCFKAFDRKYRSNNLEALYYREKISDEIDNFHDHDRLKRVMKYVIHEAIVNAIVYGNKRSRKKLNIKLFLGQHGRLAQITNQGEGFDYEKVNAERIIHNKGHGFHLYRTQPVYVSFENQGRTVNILGLVEDMKTEQ
jgi:anti-sigma regulatory factor (Ser/Thr protein kinase)